MASRFGRQQVDSATRRVSWFLLAVTAIAVAALQLLDPGAGPLEHPLSAYALGPYAWLWVVAVLCAGLAMLLIARRAVREPGTAFLAMAGVALILVAIFPTDPWYPWQHSLTWTGWIHVIATGTGMASLGASMLCDVIPRRDMSIPKHRRVVATTYLAALAWVGAFTITLLVLGRDPPFIGLDERVLLTLALLWLASRA